MPREAAQTAVQDMSMVNIKSEPIKPKNAGKSTETWRSAAMDNEEIMEISPCVVKAVSIEVKAENAEIDEDPTEVASENIPEDAAVELKMLR